MLRLKKRNPPFDAVYAANDAVPTMPDTELILTIDPPNGVSVAVSRASGAARSSPRERPFKVDAQGLLPLLEGCLLDILRQHQTGIVHQDIEAFAVLRDMLDNARPGGWIGDIEFERVALPPSPAILSATFCARSFDISVTTTMAPSEASRAETAAPMPRPPPVTSATRAASLPGITPVQPRADDRRGGF